MCFDSNFLILMFYSKTIDLLTKMSSNESWYVCLLYRRGSSRSHLFSAVIYKLYCRWCVVAEVAVVEWYQEVTRIQCNHESLIVESGRTLFLLILCHLSALMYFIWCVLCYPFKSIIKMTSRKYTLTFSSGEDWRFYINADFKYLCHNWKQAVLNICSLSRK